MAELTPMEVAAATGGLFVIGAFLLILLVIVAGIGFSIAHWGFGI